MNLDSRVVGSSTRTWVAQKLSMRIRRLASSRGRSDNEILPKDRCNKSLLDRSHNLFPSHKNASHWFMERSVQYHWLHIPHTFPFTS